MVKCQGRLEVAAVKFGLCTDNTASNYVHTVFADPTSVSILNVYHCNPCMYSTIVCVHCIFCFHLMLDCGALGRYFSSWTA